MGPDIRKGYVSQLRSGNVDVAPTVLAILGVNPPRPMDGRVLYEALTFGDVTNLKSIEDTIETSHDLGFLVWHQYLKTIKVGKMVYFEEGNGEYTLK